MAYLGLPIMAVAIVGLIAAMFYFFKTDVVANENENGGFEDGI